MIFHFTKHPVPKNESNVTWDSKGINKRESIRKNKGFVVQFIDTMLHQSMYA